MGHGILTGITEVEDPQICCAIDKMLASADRREVTQTVLDLAALATALCSALAEVSNTSTSDVLDCVLAR